MSIAVALFHANQSMMTLVECVALVVALLDAVGTMADVEQVKERVSLPPAAPVLRPLARLVHRLAVT